MIQIIDAICWWFIEIVAYVVQFVGVGRGFGKPFRRPYPCDEPLERGTKVIRYDGKIRGLFREYPSRVEKEVVKICKKNRKRTNA